MFIRPLRLLALLLGIVIIGAPLAAIALFVLSVTGSPGTCAPEGELPQVSDELAASFDRKWDQLSSALGAGQVSTAVFTQDEVTSRARQWVEEHDLSVRDLYICFTPEGALASGTVDLPVLPFEMDVLLQGRVTLTGAHPEVTIDEIEVGRLPSFFTGLVLGPLTSLIDDQMQQLPLRHDYGLAFDDGEVTISGQPAVQ